MNEWSAATDLVAVPTDAHEEVVGFEIAVTEVLAVHVLHATDHLQQAFHINAVTSNIKMAAAHSNAQKPEQIGDIREIKRGSNF